MLNTQISKEKWLAILMALLTVIFCLVIADGILGTDGHVEKGEGVEGNTWYIHDQTGLIFFRRSMIVITVVFALLVDWKHIWVVIPVYTLLYLPVNAYFGESPQHTYLDKSTFAMFTIGPDLSFLRPLLTAIQFWVMQSLIFLAVWPVRALVKWLAKRGKGITEA